MADLKRDIEVHAIIGALFLNAFGIIWKSTRINTPVSHIAEAPFLIFGTFMGFVTGIIGFMAVAKSLIMYRKEYGSVKNIFDLDWKKGDDST